MSTIAKAAFAVQPFTLDQGVSHRAAIGLVVLATDHTIEHEWRNLLRLDGVGFYECRLANSPDISPETLAAMEKDIAASVALIRPGERIDVVAFGCTSGAMVIGEEKVFERIREARPGVACTTPITAALAGLRALGAKRIALLTPYVRSVSEWMASYIEARDIQVVKAGSFNHANDNEVARIDAQSIRNAVLDLGSDDAVDAVFVSCTSLRVASQVTELEQLLGKPVLSSNHAMAWHALRLGGVQDKVPHLGRLFDL
ncbi:aspartate/glutamate racemase family protein [Thermomonas sp.]|uniref:maleate cis-trans isomerase family protein n=1 Tax=Thermomonas sp. TaxID=1971895 RepID=UPI0024879A83|nr:aspartate/glutamate racemase family protein [Thermomonas sp.]MDI1251599.1 aspartate/glutamate racemase family protein [Thermomonas sp.]